MKEHPHRRWFLTHYRLPPNDERYLSLTDAEILFDFYTVQAMKKTESTTDTDSTTSPPVPMVPMPSGADTRQTLWDVRADADEFREWLHSRRTI